MAHIKTFFYAKQEKLINSEEFFDYLNDNMKR